MASDIKLLPCPFCGGKAYIKQCSHGYSSSRFNIKTEIGCSECEICMTAESVFDVSPYMDIHIFEDGIKSMIDRWNTRKEGAKNE